MKKIIIPGTEKQIKLKELKEKTNPTNKDIQQLLILVLEKLEEK